MTNSAPAPRTKAIFLDIDGTFADRGQVPPAHVEAVRSARAAGHKVLLCTGRPLSLIFPHMLEAGFDGIVAAAGAHVTVDETVLTDLRFASDLARRTVAALDRNHAVYWLETPEATYATRATIEPLR